MVSHEQRPEFFDFINKILDVEFDPEKSRCIASVTDDFKIMGVVVFDRFSPFNCELSVASATPRFMNRAFLKAVFRYPFVQLGLSRISAVIEDGNIHAIEMDRRLGFVDEAKLKNWYGDKDGFMLRMLKEECKWL